MIGLMAGLIYLCSIPPTALFLLFMKYQTPLFTLSCTDEHFKVGLLFVMERYRFHNLYLKSGSNQYPHLLHVLNIFNRVIFLSHRHIGIIIALSGLLLKLLLFVFIFISANQRHWWQSCFNYLYKKKHLSFLLFQ